MIKIYEKVRANIIVKGNVQKVFFRSHTAEEAKELGLTGWVKNRNDGSVVIVAEGQKNAVNELILWCKEGPRFAHVENVEVNFQKYTGEFKDFTIDKD